MANQDCYDNRDGPTSQEWEAFELIHSVVDANYCVDNDNLFVAGFSTGGWLANMWGCYFAGDGAHPWNGVPGGGGADASPRRFAPKYHLRGQAVVDGGEPDNNPPCNGPIAAIWLHARNDYATAYDQAALARTLRMNGCEGSPTAPWHPEIVGLGVCQQYTACPASYPVVFCEDDHCHADDHERAIPAFKLFFDEASASPTH
jgi:poly(3-hydroxybutyrate) depolymerase